MRKKHEETLKAIFHQPVLSSVKWKDVELLFAALGAEIEEGRGSRVEGSHFAERSSFSISSTSS